MPCDVSSQTSSPSATRPISGRSRPATTRSTVVLPAPDGPTRASVSRPIASVYREAERAKGMRDVELERHPKKSFTVSRSVALTRTRSALIASAPSKSTSNSW